MVTVDNLIKALTELSENGGGNLPIIYSKDDEGNDFHKVNNLPLLVQVHDINEYYLEWVGEFNPDSDNIAREDCNCVIIN